MTGEQRDDNLHEGLTTTTEGEVDPRVAAGMKWSLVSTILARVITPITSIILAHFLVPEDFGVFAVAVAVQAALLSFNDLGVANAVIWWPGDVGQATRTATSLSLASSAALYATCFFGAPYISEFLNVPEATGVLRLLTVIVVIDGLAAVPIGLIGREYQQGQRALADWFGFVVATGLTIFLAVQGYGAWSMAWGQVVGALLTTTILFLVSRTPLRFGFDRDIARQLVSYGLPLAGSSLLVFAMLNVDYLIVGRVLGATALGLYSIAFNLSSWPSNVVSMTMRRVSIPVFARLRNSRPALSRTFLAGLHNVALFTALLCAGLFALAVPIVELLYPADYVGAAAPLALLAILGLGRVTIDFFYDLLAGTGRSRTLMALQFLWVAALIPALSIGAHLGELRGVAAAHAMVAWLIMVPAYSAMARTDSIPMGATVRALARPVLSACAAAACGVFMVWRTGTGTLGLLLGGLTVTTVYLATAAPPRDLLSLPSRLIRFEGTGDGPGSGQPLDGGNDPAKGRPEPAAESRE